MHHGTGSLVFGYADSGAPPLAFVARHVRRHFAGIAPLVSRTVPPQRGFGIRECASAVDVLNWPALPDGDRGDHSFLHVASIIIFGTLWGFAFKELPNRDVARGASCGWASARGPCTSTGN